MQTILRFEISGEPAPGELEADVALAFFAAECVFGRPRMRFEASYLLDQSGSSCVLKAFGEAGEAAARILAGLTAARVGDASFSVRRLQGAE
jgi:hypothetical protein